jgi:hypothetical protein
MGEKVVVERLEFDRLVGMRADLDQYEAQLIPDLQRHVLMLGNALRELVDAVGEGEHQPGSPAVGRQRAARENALSLLGEQQAPEAKRRRFSR